MDMTLLMFSMLFGTVGMGFLMYGRKAGELLPVGVGLLLMICPYFISNLIILLFVCIALTSVPFFARNG